MAIRWHFGPGGAEAHGPQDSITRTFTGNKYYSLAREVIQNSLDAVLDRTEAVRVSFGLFDLDRTELPGIFSLQDAISRCAENYSDVPHFVDFCTKAKLLLSCNSLTCLRISDYNTKGLVFGEGKTPFYAFMEAVGYTLKDSSSSGGSFGFGKGAYYAASSLRTLMISSVYGEGAHVFQGKARLTTHFDDEGNKRDYTGLLGGEMGKPITDPSVLPPSLVRSEKGTDVVLVGFDDDDDTWTDELIKSVLNNFWLAIWDGELIVDVAGVSITKDTLENTIEKYYSEQDDDGKTAEPEGWNPYIYFKAVRYKDGPNNRFFERSLPTLGKCKLYLHIKDGLPNRTMFARAPKMTVFKRTSNKASNYIGVFVCEDDKGNEILRAMENPEHNQWRKTNYLKDGKPHPDARKAELEYADFVNSCLEDIQTAHSGIKQRIIGLEEYLTIPEDLLADEEGEGTGGSSGIDVTSENADGETAVERSRKGSEPLEITLDVRRQTNVLRSAQGSDDGDEPIFTGNPGDDGEGGDGSAGSEPGHHVSLGGDDVDIPTKKPVPIRSRVGTQVLPDRSIIHNVKVFSTMIAKAELEFFAGVDNDGGDDDSLVILSAHGAAGPIEFSGNKIISIDLVNGENAIRVMFDSPHKHSLRIKSYEVQ